MKYILLAIGIFSTSYTFAQSAKTRTVKELMTFAEISGKKVVNDLNSSALFSKYYTIDKKESSIVGDFSFTDLQSGNYELDNVIGYIITFRLKSEFFPIKNTHNISFKIHLNKELKMDYSEIWNSRWSPAVEGNLEVKYDELPEKYHQKFILSQLNFIQKIEEKKILKEMDISNFLQEKYSSKTFADPEISRDSLPPYDVHFIVKENKCSDCLQLEIPVDNFEGTKTSKFEKVILK